MKKILVGLLLIGVCGLAYGGGGDVERAPAIRKTTGGYTMGNVGIGTTDTSAAALTVVGDVSVSGTMTVNGTGVSEYLGGLVVGENGVSGTEGTIELRDGNNPGTSVTLEESEWADLEGTSGVLIGNGDGTFDSGTSTAVTLLNATIDGTTGSALINNSEQAINKTQTSIWGNNFSQTSESAQILDYNFYDSSFGDDEVYMMSTSPNAITLSYTGKGTAGVQGFETAFVNSNSDIDLPLSWSSSGLDNDGGTPGSVSGDYCERSGTQKVTGNYSAHIRTNAGSEGIIQSGVNFTAGYWYRSSIKLRVASGSNDWQVKVPSISQFNSSTAAGTANTNVLSDDTWYNFSQDFLSLSSLTYSNVVSTISASGEIFIDDFSQERIRPIFGDFTLTSSDGEWVDFIVTNTDVVIDDGEDAWDESVIAETTHTADGTIFHEGTYSAKTEITDVFTTGYVAREVINIDMTTTDAISLWVYSTVAIGNGEYRIKFDDTAGGSTDVFECHLPAISANTWTFVKVSINLKSNLTSVPTPIISLGLYQNVDKGAMSIYIDDVRAYRYGVVNIKAQSTNVDNASTDGNLCVYERGRFITPAIENKRGAAVSLLLKGKYAYME